MLLNVLASTADKTRSVPISEAALYALLGFLIVFVGISLLILVVWAVGRVIVATRGNNTPKAKKVEEVKTVNAPISAVNQDEVDDETLAVIMAALAMYYQKNNPKCEFTVKRIKRF